MYDCGHESILHRQIIHLTAYRGVATSVYRHNDRSHIEPLIRHKRMELRKEQRQDVVENKNKPVRIYAGLYAALQGGDDSCSQVLIEFKLAQATQMNSIVAEGSGLNLWGPKSLHTPKCSTVRWKVP